MANLKPSSDPRKLYNLNINSYQDINNIENTITANAVLHTDPYPPNNPQTHTNHHNHIAIPRSTNTNRSYEGSYSPSASASTSASSSTFSNPTHRHNATLQETHETDEDTQDTEYTEEQQKFNYHYNLLVYMRHPQQHARIAYDAQISALCIAIWCIFNMFFGFSAAPSLQLIPTTIGDADPLSMAAQTLNIEKLYQRQEIFNNLLVFLIAILVIHKDIILCNAQLCMPMLLLFCFNIRFSIQYVIKFELSWDSVNIVCCLVLLWFMCCRFFFNIFKSSKYDIHWNLMRCHFFYRGFYIRWISYLIYSWFNSLMVLQLMDSVCLSDGQLKSKLCQMHRIKFIGCDMVIVIYCIMVLGIWNRLQFVDAEQLKQYKLSVKSHGVKELFVFIGMLVWCNFMCDTFLTKLVVKKMLLPFTVVVILVSNFLMR
eukprot:156017_1